MPLPPRSILTFPEDTNPFSLEFFDSLNVIAGQTVENQRLIGDIELKIQEPEIVPETTAVETTIIALVIGIVGSTWPRQYQWVEGRLTGDRLAPTYATLPDGKNFTTHGLATNRNETIVGFGDEVGPWGAVLDVTRATLAVRPIQPGQPILIKLEDLTINVGEEDEEVIKVPMFTGDNPYTVSCLSLSAPSGPPLGDFPEL